MPRDADQITNLAAELDALDTPTTDEVLLHTRDYDDRIVAAEAAQRAINGGGGGGGSQTLAQVLAEGNHGGGHSMDGIDSIDVGTEILVGDTITLSGGAVQAQSVAADTLSASDFTVDEDGIHNATLYSDMDAGGNFINNLADPSGDQDAATKAYVDATAPTVDEKGALDAANDPDANNPFATMDDVGGGGAFLTGAGPPGAGQNEIAYVGITSNPPTEGTFKVRFAGEVTAALAYNISPADFITALEGLSSILPGSVQTPAGYETADLTGGGVYVQFIGIWGGQDVPAATIEDDTTDDTLIWVEDTPGAAGVSGSAGDRYLDTDSVTGGAGDIYTYTGSEWIQANTP